MLFPPVHPPFIVVGYSNFFVHTISYRTISITRAVHYFFTVVLDVTVALLVLVLGTTVVVVAAPAVAEVATVVELGVGVVELLVVVVRFDNVGEIKSTSSCSS